MSGALLLKRSAALLRLLRSSSTLLDGGTCRPASAVASVALAACTTLPWSSSTVSEKLSTSCCRQRTERGTRLRQEVAEAANRRYSPWTSCTTHSEPCQCQRARIASRTRSA